MPLTLLTILILALGVAGHATFRDPGVKNAFKSAASLGILGLFCALAWGLVASIWDHLP